MYVTVLAVVAGMTVGVPVGVAFLAAAVALITSVGASMITCVLLYIYV